jgi:hypothetical protein
MTVKARLASLRVAAIAIIFGSGYLAGALTQTRNAQADLKDLGGSVLERASESGGVVGNVARLGSTIGELEKHVSGMQKNIDTLKSVRAALGGASK